MKSGSYRVCVLASAFLASLVRADSFNLTRFYSVHAGTALVETKGPSSELPSGLSLGVGGVSFALSQLPPLRIGFLPVLRTNVGLASGHGAQLTVEKSGKVLYSKRIERAFEPLTIVLGPIDASDRLRFTVKSDDPSARVVMDYPTIDPMWAIPLRAMPSSAGHWTLELGGLMGNADYRLVTPISAAHCEARTYLTHREPITQTFTRSFDGRTRLTNDETGSLDVALGFFHRTEKLAWHLEAPCDLSLGTTYLLESGPAKKLGVRLDKASAGTLADRFSPLNQSGIPWARGGLVRVAVEDEGGRGLALRSMGFQVIAHVESEAALRGLAALGKKMEIVEASDPKLLLTLFRIRESGALPNFTSASLVLYSEGSVDPEAARVADVLAIPAEQLDRAFETVGRAKPIWIVESGKHRLSAARDPLALLESIQAAAQHPMAQVTAVILDENEPGPGTAAPPESRMVGAYNP